MPTSCSTTGARARCCTLLKDHARADVLLLRLAIAAKAVDGPRSATRWRASSARASTPARARGDTSHRKEEARYALAVQGQARARARAGTRQLRQQRELADARIVLEAALARASARRRSRCCSGCGERGRKPGAARAGRQAAGAVPMTRDGALRRAASADRVPAAGAGSAQAHKPSDSYLTITQGRQRCSAAAGTSRCAISTSRSGWMPTATARSPGARCAPSTPTSQPTRLRGWRCKATTARRAA
jgi:hypothetical protein